MKNALLRNVILTGAIFAFGFGGFRMIQGFAFGADRPTASDAAQETAIHEAIIGANNVSMTLGSYQSADGRVCSMSEEEIDAALNAYDKQADRYYTALNPNREAYKKQKRYILTEAEHPYLSYCAGTGTDHVKLNDIDWSQDGTQAVVQYTDTIWSVCVEEEQDGMYAVFASLNDETVTALFEQEDGVWKVSKTMEYELSLDSKDARSVNQTDKRYASFEEALAEANALCAKLKNK